LLEITGNIYLRIRRVNMKFVSFPFSIVFIEPTTHTSCAQAYFIGNRRIRFLKEK